MTAYDHWLTGGNYSKQAVYLKCVEPQECFSGMCVDECDPVLGCGWEGQGIAWSEYGTGGFEPEQCPECFGEVAEVR